jgi:hypothetical protein
MPRGSSEPIARPRERLVEEIQPEAYFRAHRTTRYHGARSATCLAYTELRRLG